MSRFAARWRATFSACRHLRLRLAPPPFGGRRPRRRLRERRAPPLQAARKARAPGARPPWRRSGATRRVPAEAARNTSPATAAPAPSRGRQALGAQFTAGRRSNLTPLRCGPSLTLPRDGKAHRRGGGPRSGGSATCVCGARTARFETLDNPPVAHRQFLTEGSVEEVVDDACGR